MFIVEGEKDSEAEALSTGQTLVKRWSNVEGGKNLAKNWSNTGSTLVKQGGKAGNGSGETQRKR